MSRSEIIARHLASEDETRISKALKIRLPAIRQVIAEITDRERLEYAISQARRAELLHRAAAISAAAKAIACESADGKSKFSAAANSAETALAKARKDVAELEAKRDAGARPERHVAQPRLVA